MRNSSLPLGHYFQIHSEHKLNRNGNENLFIRGLGLRVAKINYKQIK